jgi:transcriptional regulator with XRE-family HTH domain
LNGVFYLGLLMKNTEDLLGVRLRQLMEHHGLVEAELSKHSGLPMITISRLKTGHTDDPRLSTLQKLASFFCISVSQLIGEEPLALDSRQKRRYFRIPLFIGNQWTEWATHDFSDEVIQTMELSWIYTDQVSSAKSFALEITSNLYGSLFPKNSVIFVDQILSVEHSCHVLVADKKHQDYFIAQKIKMLFDDYLVHPTNHTIHTPFDQTKHEILGVISGIKTYSL